MLVPRKCLLCEGHETSGKSRGREFVCDPCCREDSFAARLGLEALDEDEAAAHWERYFTVFFDTSEGWEPWKATKTGFRCSSCQHVLPWLRDQPNALCAKCSMGVAKKKFEASLLEKFESRKSSD